MLIINPTKPFYIDKADKKIRMGNFSDTGKEIEYEDEDILTIFDSVKIPIEKEELIQIVSKKTKANKADVLMAIEYLIDEKFIVDDYTYNEILLDKKFNRQNLFFSMFNDLYEKVDEKFKNQKILILGLGGIGSNVALMLSRAGFDTFCLVDFDKVDESNLIRQLPYNKKDIDSYKTDVLKEKINSNGIKIIKKNKEIIKEEDIIDEIRDADFVLCTLDKPSRIIRRLINKICVELNKPVLFSGFSEHIGMVGPFVVPKISACLMCIEHDLNEYPLGNVSTVPSYGPLCFLISSITSNEIINYFAKYNKKNLIGKTLMFNIATYETKIIKWKKTKKCKVCGEYDSK